jgi:hypothetical protein
VNDQSGAPTWARDNRSRPSSSPASRPYEPERPAPRRHTRCLVNDDGQMRALVNGTIDEQVN